jgi:hypothetical protein
MKTTDLIAAQAFVKEMQYKAPKPDEYDEPLVRMYTRWIKDGNVFSPVGNVSVQDELQRSAYRIRLTMQGVIYERMKPKTAELYKFKSGPMEEVLSEIDKFWDLKDDYKKLGLLYSRGILLYGPPGSGKTSILHQVSEMITAKGDVIFYSNDIRALAEGLKAFRSVEPERRVVIILEDADEHVRHDEQQFLHLLDGQDSTDNIVYLATTNYIHNFPPRLLRSGRFDKKIEVPQPPREGRLIFFQNKLKSNDMATDSEIEQLADDTEGMSFGDLLEIVTAHYALKEPLDSVMKRLNKNLDKDEPASNESETKESGYYLPSPKAIYRAGTETTGVNYSSLKDPM